MVSSPDAGGVGVSIPRDSTQSLAIPGDQVHLVAAILAIGMGIPPSQEDPIKAAVGVVHRYRQVLRILGRASDSKRGEQQ